MSRPQPTIVLRHVDSDRLETDVIYADSVWVVCYRDAPITVRRGPEGNRYPGFKYLKSAWPHPGHAHNMADRLNELFDTDEFTVWQMKPHKLIKEPEPRIPKEYNRTWEPTRFTADDIVTHPGQKPKRLP